MTPGRRCHLRRGSTIFTFWFGKVTFLVLQSYFFGFAKLLFGFSTAKICLNPVLMSMNFNGGVANLGSSDSILIQVIQLVVTGEK